MTTPLQADDAGGEEDEEDDADEDEDDGEDEDGGDEEEEDDDDGREEYTDYGAILGGDADAYDDEVCLRWLFLCGSGAVYVRHCTRLFKEIGLCSCIVSCQAFNSTTPCSARLHFHERLWAHAFSSSVRADTRMASVLILVSS